MSTTKPTHQDRPATTGESASATSTSGTFASATSFASGTSLVDEFLGKHGAALPSHVIDFALDVRTLIGELEAELADEPVGV